MIMSMVVMIIIFIIMTTPPRVALFGIICQHCHDHHDSCCFDDHHGFNHNGHHYFNDDQDRSPGAAKVFISQPLVLLHLRLLLPLLLLHAQLDLWQVK